MHRKVCGIVHLMIINTDRIGSVRGSAKKWRGIANSGIDFPIVLGEFDCL